MDINKVKPQKTKSDLIYDQFIEILLSNNKDTSEDEYDSHVLDTGVKEAAYKSRSVAPSIVPKPQYCRIEFGRVVNERFIVSGVNVSPAEDYVINFKESNEKYFIKTLKLRTGLIRLS